MWIDRILSSRATDALDLTARFAEARQRVLAENVANIDTPDYQTRVLDPRQFQAVLQGALDDAQADGRQRLELRGNAQVATDAGGRLVTRPALEPAKNVLFHDGTNARMEDLMGDVSENALLYQFATSALGSRYEGLLSAIRGRIG